MKKRRSDFARCPVCKRLQPLTKRGRIVEHLIAVDTQHDCPGAGQMPVARRSARRTGRG